MNCTDTIIEIARHLDIRSVHTLRRVNSLCYRTLQPHYLEWLERVAPLRESVQRQHERYSALLPETKEACAQQLEFYYDDYLPQMRRDWRSYYELDLPYDLVYLIKAMLDFPLPVLRIIPPSVLAEMLKRTQSEWVLICYVTAVVSCCGGLRFFNVDPYDEHVVSYEILYDSDLIIYSPVSRCFGHTVVDLPGYTECQARIVNYMCGFARDTKDLPKFYTSHLSDSEINSQGFRAVELSDALDSVESAWQKIDQILSTYDEDVDIKTEDAVLRADKTWLIED